MIEREGERRLSLFSFISSLRGGCASARVVFESERERERDGKFSRSVALLVEKEFGDLVLRAPDKDTERHRERESDRFDERVDSQKRPGVKREDGGRRESELVRQRRRVLCVSFSSLNLSFADTLANLLLLLLLLLQK